MDYHYETQPIPNPLSWYFHNNTRWFHSFEVGVNHFVELLAPWFIFFPWRQVRNLAGLIQIGFQGILILSGNLSFLNWLTICPAIMCLDDRFLYFFLSPFLTKSFKRRLTQVQTLHPVAKRGQPANIKTYVLSAIGVSTYLSPSEATHWRGTGHRHVLLSVQHGGLANICGCWSLLHLHCWLRIWASVRLPISSRRIRLWTGTLVKLTVKGDIPSFRHTSPILTYVIGHSTI